MSEPSDRPRATIYLSIPTELYERLETYAALEQSSVDAILERALTEYLDLVERVHPRSRSIVRRLTSEDWP